MARIEVGKGHRAGLEVVVVLIAAVLACGMLGERLRIVPRLGGVLLPPDVVLMLFLPALLYWESLTTSLREIRTNLRSILLMSIGLVLCTAATVAVAAHACGLPWSSAWVLGAVGAIARSLPRRPVTGAAAGRVREEYTELRLAVLGHKRDAVIRLRDERRIDDIVLCQVQAALDAEEVRLLRAEPSDA
jgi:hypothetical protein